MRFLCLVSYLYVVREYVVEVMPRIKLVVFDMDNVLFDVGYFEHHEGAAASTWGAIWHALGDEENHARLKNKWSGGEYKRQSEWAEEALRTFRAHGLTEERFFKIINGLPLMKGAKETISELKKKGILTAIISGSFSELAMRARREIGIDMPIAICSLIFENGLLKDWTVLPFDYKGKAYAFDALAKSLDISPGECAFVCDGVNDIELASKVGLPIAFGARDELKPHCKVVIEDKDLRNILKYIE